MAETKTAAKTRAKPSGVRSESAAEAGQIRKLASLVAALTERVDTLETVARALSRGNLETAQEEMDSHL